MKTTPKTPLEINYIQHFAHIMGNDIEFENEMFFTLNVGDKVRKIGKGNPTSSNRTLVITPYLVYVGSKLLPFNGKEDKFFMFLLPTQAYDQNIYLCIAQTAENEMLIPMWIENRGGGMYIMKAFFEIVTEIKTIQLCIHCAHNKKDYEVCKKCYWIGTQQKYHSDNK